MNREQLEAMKTESGLEGYELFKFLQSKLNAEFQEPNLPETLVTCKDIMKEAMQEVVRDDETGKWHNYDRNMDSADISDPFDTENEAIAYTVAAVMSAS